MRFLSHITHPRPRSAKRDGHTSHIVFICLILFLLFTVHCSLFTDFSFATYEAKIKEYDKKIQEEKKKKEQAKKKLTVQKKRLKKKKVQEQGIHRELNRLQRNLGIKEKEIAVYNKNLKKNQAKLEKKTEDLTGRNQEIQAFQGILRKRLITIYKKRYPAYPRDFSREIKEKKYGKVIVLYDATKLAESEKEKERIEKEKGELEKKRTRITTCKETASGIRNKLRKNKRGKEKLLAKTKKERLAYQKRVAELEKASKKLANLLKKLEAKKKETLEQARLASLAFKQKQGHLPWPTASRRVIRTYGKHQHPRYKTYTFHKGIDIKAPLKAEVRSASKGRVAFAQWSTQPGLRDYGKMIMLSHGGGYYTLYAHLDSILVKENREVAGGHLIGKVGQTASKKGPYLYFEIRKDGIPLNPLKWLKKVK